MTDRNWGPLNRQSNYWDHRPSAISAEKIPENNKPDSNSRYVSLQIQRLDEQVDKLQKQVRNQTHLIEKLLDLVDELRYAPGGPVASQAREDFVSRAGTQQ